MTRNHPLYSNQQTTIIIYNPYTSNPSTSDPSFLIFGFEAPNHYDALWQHHGLHFHHLHGTQRRCSAGGHSRRCRHWRQGWCGDGRRRRHWSCRGRGFHGGGPCSGCRTMPTGRPRSTRTGDLAVKGQWARIMVQASIDF